MHDIDMMWFSIVLIVGNVVIQSGGPNKAAHRLVKEGIMHGSDRVGFNVTPDSLFSILNLE
jgi:hypothetical protein